MTFLVTGATGTVGRHVVAELLRLGRDVRALSRTPDSAELPGGVEVVGGDLADVASLEAAFDGVTAVHLINFAGDSYGALDNGPDLVDLMVRKGVRRVTLLGGRDEGALEKALKASDLEWTMLTPVEFMGNTLQWWAASVRAEGVVREPFGGRLSAMVHEADIGAVAATVLAEGGYAGRELVLTGPEAITTAEKVRILAGAVGRDIAFVELTEREAREKWAADGMPGELIEFLVDALGNTPEVGYTVVPTVPEVLGRPARTFAQWAAENAAAFRSED
ncbi:NAD(P)H-binding protein [Actinomadura kijaniata]|uniref:NAD(P)H-binding protein n=1 Tax=Actinomadura kijaniata TaxID=46161 RepID=UPI003F1CA8CC